MTDHDNEISNDAVGSDGIFLRASDRRRFDYVMRSLRENSLSLALSSDNEGVLDHYGRMVLARLRKTEGLQIEVFLPQNTEQLLERFNQILAGVSLEDARRTEGSPAPRRVLIAHDAKAVSVRDLQLVARLVKDFPGANVSLVLLVDRAGMQLHERTLDIFGQRLLRWPVEAPTRSEGDALLKVGRAIGFEVEVKKLLAATGYAELRIAPQPKAAPEPDNAAQTRFEAHLAAARAERPAQETGERPARTEPTLDGAPPAPSKPFTEPPRARRVLGKVLRWTAAMVLLLAVSAAVVLLLFAQNLSPVIVNSPILKDNLPPWAMDAVVAVVGKPPSAALAPITPAEPAAPAGATVPAAAADLPREQPAPAAPEATAADAAKPEPAPPEPVKAVPATAEAAKAEPAKAEAPPAPTAVPAAEPAKAALAKAEPADVLAPRSERGVDQLVRQTRPGSFFVQHVSLGSMAEAQEWRAQHRALAQARIAAVSTPDEGVKFAVISGPFANRKEAEGFAGRPGIPADPWLRPLKSLQDALQPAGR